MSFGIMPYDFVQQVYYAQEKVILDFRPTDDKYKEVLMEANLVLQSLQKDEDWSFLRNRLVLGDLKTDHHHPIPEFELPAWVYKPCDQMGDCLKIYREHHGAPDETRGWMEVPWVQASKMHHHDLYEVSPLGRTNVPRPMLEAVWMGNTVTFNRPLTRFEQYGIAVTDVVERL